MPSRKARPRVRHLLQVIVPLALAALGPARASAAEYELGVQDRVRITVVEWTLDEMRSPISGEYVVGPGGDIFLPLLGAVPALGKPVSELSGEVSQLLAAKLGLSKLPSTSVEIVQFRPFYIIGEITNAGEFAYRPGMTVLQAVSLAGGFPKPATSRLQAERDLIGERSTIAASQSALDGLLARQARLQAELAGNETIAFPEAMLARRKEPEIARALSAEETIFAARRSAAALGVRSEVELQSMLSREKEALDRHAEALKRQVATSQEQLDTVRRMRDRGLSSPTRELDLDRLLAEAQSKLIEVEKQRVRSDREFSLLRDENQRNRASLRQQVANEIGETTARIEDLRNRARASQSLIDLTRLQTAPDATPRYRIVRDDPDSEGGVIELAADERTRIRPGDVVKVAFDRVPVGEVEAPHPPEDASVRAPTPSEETSPMSPADGEQPENS